MKTLHLGPEELLVAAKVAVRQGATAEEVAASIDAAERAVREAEPTAQVIYLEPDIYRADYVAGRAAGAAAARGALSPSPLLVQTGCRRGCVEDSAFGLNAF